MFFGGKCKAKPPRVAAGASSRNGAPNRFPASGKGAAAIGNAYQSPRAILKSDPDRIAIAAL
jgi:hypothetical protein